MGKINFKPFDKVLARDNSSDTWIASLFSRKLPNGQFETVCGYYNECIPFSGNEHLLGTTDNYIESWQPKDGDFVVSKDRDSVFIYKESKDDKNTFYVQVELTGGEGIYMDDELHYGYKDEVSFIPATEEEKQQLLDALHKDGKDWDAEKMEIVEYRWKPKNGEEYWYISHLMRQRSSFWYNDETDNKRHEAGNCFGTEAEAQAMTDKFKELLKNK